MSAGRPAGPHALRTHVVATAGHVDHGKSTLLRALTGMEPDRWAEERARGLTIDLGFVWTTLSVPEKEGLRPDGGRARQELRPGGGSEEPPGGGGGSDGGRARPSLRVAFVDVPGHERFIANMLAGAGAVRAALFVVAADDGWSAQSQEHLDILTLLEIDDLVATVAKADAVPGERVEQVAADVRARLGGGERTVPVVATDAMTGRGVDELRAVLAARLWAASEAPDLRRPRLWVDRSFTIGGAGTVVTGTLEGGQLRVGDGVALLPGPRPARVRGLQALGEPVDAAPPGTRVAVNLAGVDRDEVGRGHAVVGRAGDWVTTELLDGWVRALPGHEIDRAGAWHLHVGSAETVVTVHPLLGDPIRPAAPGYVRLRLGRRLPLQVGDRFVLREAGRRATVGGGSVVDPDPPGRVRGAEQRLDRADRLDAVRRAADAPARLTALVDAGGGARSAAVVAAAAGIDGAPRADELVEVGRWLVRTGVRDRWAQRVAAALRDVHAREPDRPGMARTELARAAREAGCPDGALAEALPDHLVAAGRLRRDGAAYALPEHAGAADRGRQERSARLVALLASEPFAPPALEDAAGQAGVPYPEVQALVQQGTIVRCGALAFTRGAVDRAVELLGELYERSGPFTAAQAKDAWATTRKYAIPLLEHLDATGVTDFDGQTRRLRGG